MFNIKTIDNINENGLSVFSEKYIINGCQTEDAILVRSSNLHDYEMPDTLKAIARAGAGVNNIPIDVCSQKGIVVFNTPGANANAVKELVIAGLLVSSRDVLGGVGWLKSLSCEDNVPQLVEKNKSRFAGSEIKGKTLGVIGLGAIGALVANAAEALEMDVLGYDPFISVDAAWKLNKAVDKADVLEDVFEKADYISIHIPLLDNTKNMINAETISRMKDGVVILNFSRDALVDDEALAQALATGKVAKYVTDFPNNTIMTMKNVIAIPHLGASTPESEINCAVMAAKQTKDYLEHGIIKNAVNYPDCDMGYCRAIGRVAIQHRNIPNMISQISAVFSKDGINIEDMMHRGKKELAYTILDVEEHLDDRVLSELKKINGVIRARIIK